MDRPGQSTQQKRAATTTVEPPAQPSKQPRRVKSPQRAISYLNQHPAIHSVYQATPFLNICSSSSSSTSNQQKIDDLEVRMQVISGVTCYFCKPYQLIEIPTHKVCLQPNFYVCIFKLGRFLRSRYAATVETVFHTIDSNLSKYNPFVEDKTLEVRFDEATEFSVDDVKVPPPSAYAIFSARVAIYIRGIRQAGPSSDNYIPNMIVKKVEIITYDKKLGHEDDLFTSCQDDIESIPSVREISNDLSSSQSSSSSSDSCISTLCSPLAAATPDSLLAAAEMIPLAMATPDESNHSSLPDLIPISASSSSLSSAVPLAMATPDESNLSSPDSSSSLPSLVAISADPSALSPSPAPAPSPASVQQQQQSSMHPVNKASAHIWIDSTWQVYYKIQDVYICPACNAMEETAETFKRVHVNAPPFKDVSKKNLYLQLKASLPQPPPQISAARQQQSHVQPPPPQISAVRQQQRHVQPPPPQISAAAQQQSHVQPAPSQISVPEHSLPHAEHVGTRHFWQRQEDDAWKTYFGFKGVYICPGCNVMLACAAEFKRVHFNAPPFEGVRKQQLYARLRAAAATDQSGAGIEQQQLQNNDQQQQAQSSDQQQSSRSRRPRQRREQSFESELMHVRVLSSLSGACVTIEFTPKDPKPLNVSAFVVEHMDTMYDYVQRFCPANIKIQLYASAQFYQAHDPAQLSTVPQSTKAKSLDESQQTFAQFIEAHAAKLDNLYGEYNERSSGWILHNIHEVSLICSQYQQLCRLSGKSFIPTPEVIRRKHCVINVQNMDEFCFLYAILSVLKRDEIHPDTRHRVQKYVEYLHELKYNPQDFPMKLSNVAKFERSNPTLAINIIKYTPTSQWQRHVDDEDEAYVKHPSFDMIYRSRHYYTKDSDFTRLKIVNLLLLTDDGDTKSHYVGIINLEKLLNCHPNTNGCPVRIRGKICQTCLRVFRLETTFEKHQKICLHQRVHGTVFTLPECNKLEFNDWSKTIPPKFIIYADFESILQQPCDDGNDSMTTSRGRVLQVHKPIAAAFLKLNPDGSNDYEEFYGVECIIDFLIRLEHHAKAIKKWYNDNAKKDMQPLTFEQQRQYRCATSCYLCHKAFSPSNFKVRDHCHFTGQYVNAACSKCNLARRIRKPFLPVFFHNLKNYDLHHILKYALSKFRHWEVQCIPQTCEKFQSLIVFIKGCVSIRFLDSMQFLPASLAKLVDMLEPNQKVRVSSLLTNPLNVIPASAFDGKGIFPYSYVTSEEVLERNSDSLPAREVAFHDVLTNSISISDDDYQRAQGIYQAANCQSLKDYLLLYLKTDVYLLSDVFEAFRETAHREDTVDPANYFSIPGLSWSAALRKLKEPLELLTSLEMYEFFEAGIRGGMTFVNSHHATKTRDTELLYIDINNLYGHALSQKLPCRGFEWVNDQHDLQQILRDLLSSATSAESDDVGYLFQVDLHVPHELHNKLSDLPPAPLSERPPNASVPKLLLTLKDKSDYVIHGALLKYYIQVMGVQVTKIHRAVKFFQTEVFKDFIDMNTAKRASSTNKIQKDYYKLKNNSLYGKTVENLRKRQNIRLCVRRDAFIAQTSKPNFKRAMPIDENLVAAILSKECITLNRPVYIGQAVLDLSKLRMYRLQYTELQFYRELYPQCNIRILAGDTDSFFLEVTNLPLKQCLLPHMLADGLLDTSNYPTTSTLYSRQFENKIGLFKDESCGTEDYVEWVFLRPKCYSMLSANEQSSHKAKGVTKRTQLTHDQYLNVYNSYDPVATAAAESVQSVSVEQRAIVSSMHQLYTVSYNKRALSVMDDKRLWIEQNFSLPYGHCAFD